MRLGVSTLNIFLGVALKVLILCGAELTQWPEGSRLPSPVWVGLT